MSPPAANEGGDSEKADRPCHNCRRRRLRCDRTLPHCSKCEGRDIECLGYGQLFLWTGAVASRGKLAGKSSSAALYSKASSVSSSSVSPPHAPASQALETGADVDVDMDMDMNSQTGTETSPPGRFPETVTETDETMTTAAPVIMMSEASSIPVTSYDTQIACVTAPFSLNAYDSLVSGASATRALVDPLFQDIQESHRQYLAYFTNDLSHDFVSSAVPGINPFRDLVPLTQGHPLLRQLIISVSATHMFNRSKPWTGLGSANGGEVGGGRRQMLIDALVAKQQVLQMMPQALENIEAIGGELVLTAVLMLMNTELVESGKHNWKTHLEGAGKIMKYLQPQAAVDERLRNYIMADFFIYYVLDSTFRPPTRDQESFFQSCQAEDIIGKATNGYYCCPPELLEILLSASRLSAVPLDEVMSGEMATSAGTALLQRAQDVDVVAWAHDCNMDQQLDSYTMGSRIRTASAHRLATCLYILQAIPSLEAWVGEQVGEVLLEELYQALVTIPEGDSNFKATAWINFIFGASVKSEERRAWVVDRIEKSVSRSPWGFHYASVDTLTLLWRLEAEGKSSGSWVQTLRDQNVDFLVV